MNDKNSKYIDIYLLVNDHFINIRYANFNFNEKKEHLNSI